MQFSNDRFPGLLQPNPDQIPAELKSIPQWIVWFTEYDPQSEKWTKIPRQPAFTNIGASKNKKTHFSDFDTAYAAYQKYPYLGGVGFVLTPDTPFVFFDLDHCVNDGFVSPDAQDVIDSVGSYTELSPSGKGIRIICRGKLPGKQINNHRLKRELYDGQKNSFLTITGQTFINNKIVSAQQQVNFFYKEWDTHSTDEKSIISFKKDFIADVDLSNLPPHTLRLIHGENWSSFPSRSEVLFVVCIDMLKAGYSTDDILSVTTDDNYPISQVAESRRHNNRESQRVWVSNYSLSKAMTIYNEWLKTESIDISSIIDNTVLKNAIDPYIKPQQHPISLLRLPGILGEIEDYYNATAKIPQPMFAQQTALGLLSVKLGRRFKTVFSDYSSLYFCNLTKSTNGKEHIKTTTEKILDAWGNKDLIAGDGYTSAGAVISALKEKPVHISIIDEFGLYLEASNNRNNHIGRSANTALMECIGRLNGEVRSKNYSTHGVKNSAVAETIVNPAITLHGLTTPATFYKHLTLDLIQDGFFGRFITVHSKAHRVPPRKVRELPVSKSIIEWGNAIDSRIHDALNVFFLNSAAIGEQVIIDVSPDAEDVLTTFSCEMVELMNSLESEGIDVIAGRAGEFAGRLALIIELAIDPYATCISKKAAVIAVAYMRDRTLELVTDIRENLNGSVYQAAKREILSAIRSLKNGVSEYEMHRNPPFAKYKDKELYEIIKALVSAELIALVNTREGKPGKKRMAYVALNDVDFT